MSEPTAPLASLVVPVERVARRLKLTPPLEPDMQALIEDAIRDAQADVEGYLGRPIVPVTVVERGLWPWSSGWSLAEDDVITVVSAVPEAYGDGQLTGTFTVTYTAGLDARTDPRLEPIRRFVIAHAVNSPALVEVWEHQQRDAGVRGQVKSVSTEGQSISYAALSQGGGGAAGSGAPGALPSLVSLNPWRRAAVFQRRTAVAYE